MGVSALYLSPSSARQVIDNQDAFGFLASPRTGVRSHIVSGAPWAMDNDAFNNGGDVDANAWCNALVSHLPYRETCLFVVVPDRPYHCAETLHRFALYAPFVHAMGYKCALATQNRMTPSMIPWKVIDVLFLGGDDEHKLGVEGGALIAEAIRRGKWVHIGRVNSRERMLKFWRANSWDGTTISREPQRAIDIARTVREIRVMKRSRKLWDM